MKIERLEELQQSINALRSIDPEEGAALIGEIWRLRTAQTGKELEVSCLKDRHDRLKAELDRIDHHAVEAGINLWAKSKGKPV